MGNYPWLMMQMLKAIGNTVTQNKSFEQQPTMCVPRREEKPLILSENKNRIQFLVRDIKYLIIEKILNDAGLRRTEHLRKTNSDFANRPKSTA